MNEYVTDTHALLWHFYAPKRLGAGARKALVAADDGDARIWIPALVIAVREPGAQAGTTWTVKCRPASSTIACKANRTNCVSLYPRIRAKRAARCGLSVLRLFSRSQRWDREIFSVRAKSALAHPFSQADREKQVPKRQGSTRHAFQERHRLARVLSTHGW